MGIYQQFDQIFTTHAQLCAETATSELAVKILISPIDLVTPRFHTREQ